MTHAFAGQPYRRELGDGLVLRWSEPTDELRLAELYQQVFRLSSTSGPNPRIGNWVHSLIGGQHPLIGPQDFALVEHVPSGTIVAATCLMTQTWVYDGVAVPVGRPEIVATLDDYRNRGLVRAIFELIHARSAARGELAIGITGIPYYYRQFGYEYALDLGGSRSLPYDRIPALKAGETEQYTLRQTTADDVPWVMALYDRDRARVVHSTAIPESYWHFLREGMHPDAAEGWVTQAIMAEATQQPVGYVLHSTHRRSPAINVIGLAVHEGVSLPAVLPGVLRALQRLELPHWKTEGEQEPPRELQFTFWRNHPVYTLLHEKLTPDAARPYAWYVHVPDVVALLRYVAPALERRLAVSVAAGYTGELKLTTYRGGLRMAFDGGRITVVEPWQAAVLDGGAMAGSPPLVLLQLIFGHRSLAQLRDSFPDVWASDEGRLLLDALFPPCTSWVLPLD